MPDQGQIGGFTRDIDFLLVFVAAGRITRIAHANVTIRFPEVLCVFGQLDGVFFGGLFRVGGFTAAGFIVECLIRGAAGIIKIADKRVDKFRAVSVNTGVEAVNRRIECSIDCSCSVLALQFISWPYPARMTLSISLPRFETAGMGSLHIRKKIVLIPGVFVATQGRINRTRHEKQAGKLN